RVVDRGGPAAEDESARRAALDLLGCDAAGHELAVDARFAHLACDELAVLRAEVEDENRVLRDLNRDFRDRPRASRYAQTPIPTRCSRCCTLPSVLIDGAMTISVSWNSSMVRAPQTPIAAFRAPTRFMLPSSTCAGPKRISRSVPLMPVRMRVPRGRLGSGVAMPQWLPCPAASAADAKIEPIMTASAPLAKALATSPPRRIPPSVMIATRSPLRRKWSSRAAAQSLVAVTWGTPTPSTARVVHAAPGPTP